MGVLRLVSDVVDAHLEGAPVLGPTEQALRGEAGDHLREDREHVDAHQRSNSPSGGSIVTRPCSCAVMKTTGTSAPLSSTSRSAAGFDSTSVTVPTASPSDEDDGRPDQLVHPEDVVVLVLQRFGLQDDPAP